jgi:hypothetical protein
MTSLSESLLAKLHIRTDALVGMITKHAWQIHHGLVHGFLQEFKEHIQSYKDIRFPIDIIATIEADEWCYPKGNYTLAYFLKGIIFDYVPLSRTHPNHLEHLMAYINETMEIIFDAFQRFHKYVLHIRNAKWIEELEQEHSIPGPPAAKRRRVDVTDVCYYDSD